MLPKIHRLTKKNDFDAVFKEGKTIKDRFLLVKSVKNGLAHARFGFVVSKKISPKATVRNKVRRRLRKAFLDVLRPVVSPIDVVVLTLPGVEKLEFSELKKSVESLYKKLI